jgi:hypothetical protein
MASEHDINMKLTKENLLLLGHKLANSITEDCSGKNGFVITTPIDVYTGIPREHICNSDDLGDYLQYIYWLAVITGDHKYESWAVEQIKRWNEHLRMPSGFYFPFFDDKKNNFPVKSNLFPVYPLENADALFGLISAYKLKNESIFIESAEYLCNGLMKYGISPKGFVYSGVVPMLRLPWVKQGYLTHQPLVSGYYIQSLCELFKETNKDKYLKTAERIISAWINTKYFKKYGVFLDRLYPFVSLPRAEKATLTKNHTIMLFGMLSYYQITEDKEIKNAVEKCLDVIENKFTGEGNAYYKLWDLKNDKFDTTMELTYDKQVIDVFIDASYFLNNDHYLKIAEKNTDFWLSLWKDGLFPESPQGQQKNNAYLDSQVDMITVMLKLHALTGRQKYLNTIDKTFEALQYYFYNNFLVNCINFSNREVVEPVCHPKYLGLMIRMLLTLHDVLFDGQDIFENDLLFLLSADR